MTIKVGKVGKGQYEKRGKRERKDGSVANGEEKYGKMSMKILFENGSMKMVV